MNEKITTTTMSLINVNNLDISAITISELTKNKQGSNTAYINCNGKRIVLRNPQMFAPFGISSFETENGNKNSIDVSFIDIDDNMNTKSFYEKLMELDAFMIEKGVENSKKWFGKQMSKDIITEFYRPLIKTGKNKPGSNDKYPDSVKFKIRNIASVEAYDTKKNRISIEDLEPRSRIRSIIEISPIWFVNKTFGLTLNLVQIEIKNPEKISGFCFEDDY